VSATVCSRPSDSFSKCTTLSTGLLWAASPFAVVGPTPPPPADVISPLFTATTGNGSGTVAHFPPSTPHCPFRFDPQANVLVSRTTIVVAPLLPLFEDADQPY
jgi:hypothetical protein